MREAATLHGVKRVVFGGNAKKVRGTYNAFTGCMFIGTNQTKKEMLVTFFHELGHHEAVKQNMWRTYHFNLVKHIDIEDVFCIENKIDRIGQKYWNKFVDKKQWGMYKYCYPKSNKKHMIQRLLDIS
jgi:hypothetical protein